MSAYITKAHGTDRMVQKARSCIIHTYIRWYIIIPLDAFGALSFILIYIYPCA